MGIVPEYIVKVFETSEGMEEIYGPYTRKQAESTLKRVERWIVREAKDADRDGPAYTVNVERLARWAPSASVVAPRRPLCGACGRKMGVWSSDYVDETFATCNNPDCENYQGGGRVIARGGRWVFTDDEGDTAEDSP